METPSSTRRVTRSQTFASAAKNSNSNVTTLREIEESEYGLTKSRQGNNGKQQDRSALTDITNDSPIVGLAMGSLETLSSAMSKKRISSRAKHVRTTPGSGEALLRGQVKTLLQKVEEEAELSKLSLENTPALHLQGFINSPLTLMAPTPANTPQISNLSTNASSHINDFASFIQSPANDDKFTISQMVSEIFQGKKQDNNESEKNLMNTRSLLLNISEKSEGSYSSECSSGVTYQEGDSEGTERATTDDEDASIWSIQVNTSTRDDQEEEDEEEGLEEAEEDCDNDNFYEEEEEENEDDAELVDDLCEAISKINVNGGRITAKFIGKHTRFVYNSDDELEGEEQGFGVKTESASTISSSVLNLKGLPTPKGKHLRFSDD